MKRTPLLFGLAVFTVSFVLRANGAEGAVEAEGEIPLHSIMWQAANLGTLLVAIYFFTKDSIREVFANRREAYLSQAEKTKVLLREAEVALKDVKTKLSDLESGEQKSLESAKKEAALLREGIARDAETASIKLKKDAELVIAAELQKAKSEISAAIVNHAVTAVAQKLSTAGASTTNQENSFLNQLEQRKA